MDRKPQEPNTITELTLRHYNQRAEAFWKATRDHDVSQNMAAMLRYIQGEPPFTLLDFGCGPGRDLKVFADSGHVAIGLEGAPRFVEMARQHSGCDVWLQDFLTLHSPKDFFDGIFANATLFHVPSGDCWRACFGNCARLSSRKAFSSVRYRAAMMRKAGAMGATAYFTLPKAGGAMRREAGFVEIEHYYRPAGLPREEQRCTRASGVDRTCDGGKRRAARSVPCVSAQTFRMESPASRHSQTSERQKGA